MKRLIIAIPHSHTWFWTQSCVAAVGKHFPGLKDLGIEHRVVVVDNSPWSPAIRGITDTPLRQCVSEIFENPKSNKFHASALDAVVENFEFDYLMALETDVLVLRDGWLAWFVKQLRPNDYAVGHWHHESYLNPSCTLYRGDVLRRMLDWCRKEAPQDELRWGESFALTAPLDNNLPLTHNPAEVLRHLKEWIGGPFAEKRGWPLGTHLKEQPSGQMKGPGWYEPGQQLHHWAIENGYTCTVCPTVTTQKENGVPTGTFYGLDQGVGGEVQLGLDDTPAQAQAVHLWGGTRALDVLKHEVTCGFVSGNTPWWLEREARYWTQVVPEDVRKQTLELIRQYGWHYRGAGTSEITNRDRDAAKYVVECYAKGGVVL